MLGTVATRSALHAPPIGTGAPRRLWRPGGRAARLHKASAYIGTFYGQIALAKVSASSRLTLPPQPQIAGWTRSFSNRELVQVTELLGAIGLSSAATLRAPTGRLARTPEDALLAMRLAKSNNSLAAEVQVSKS